MTELSQVQILLSRPVLFFVVCVFCVVWVVCLDVLFIDVVLDLWCCAWFGGEFLGLVLKVFGGVVVLGFVALPCGCKDQGKRVGFGEDQQFDTHGRRRTPKWAYRPRAECVRL